MSMPQTYSHRTPLVLAVLALILLVIDAIRRPRRVIPQTTRLPLMLSAGARAVRWVGAVGILASIVFLNYWIIAGVVAAGSPDQFASNAVALSASAVTALYVILRWYERNHAFFISLVAAGAPFAVGYFSMFMAPPMVTFVLSYVALAFALAALGFDALRNNRSVWMWHPATW